MTYRVLLEPDAHGYKATPISLPDTSVTASTREEALRAIAEAVSSRLAHAEIVDIEVPVPSDDPLAAVAGLFADDPDFIREVCAAAYAARDAEAYE